MTATINDQIKVLIELQKLDSEIYRLKKELGSHPARKAELQKELDKKRGALSAAEVQLKSLQVKQKEKENDLLSREEKIKKLGSDRKSTRLNSSH